MRIENWENELSRYLEWAVFQDFAYGSMDCVCFASNAVEIITGIDPMFEGRGQYDNLKDGAALIKKYRGSYTGIMDEYFERIPLKSAQRGDVVLYIQDKAPTYGVMGSGGRCYFKVKDKGLMPLWPKQCQLAWRVI